jgi:hypothetical protein
MTKWSMLAVALIIGWSSAVAAAPAGVVVDWTDMRSAPYSVAPLVGTLSRGEKVYVSSEVTDGWRRVISEGRLGYVRDTDVQVAGEPLSAVRAKLNPSNVAPPRIAQPWIVRPEIEWGGASDGFLSADENSIAGLAVTVGRNLTERFSTELTAGGGLFPGDIEANISPGFVTLAVARLAVALDDRIADGYRRARQVARHALEPLAIIRGRDAALCSRRAAASFPAKRVARGGPSLVS